MPTPHAGKLTPVDELRLLRDLVWQARPLGGTRRVPAAARPATTVCDMFIEQPLPHIRMPAKINAIVTTSDLQRACGSRQRPRPRRLDRTAAPRVPTSVGDEGLCGAAGGLFEAADRGLSAEDTKPAMNSAPAIG